MQKNILLVGCLFAAVLFSSTIEAQSLIGKWHRSGSKMFITDRTTGEHKALTPEQQKQFDEAAAASGYQEELEFKPDNTYVSTVSAKDRKPVARTAKYAVSGNVLDMNIPLVHNEKTTITIKSLDKSAMVWDLMFMNKLTEVMYTRDK